MPMDHAVLLSKFKSKKKRWKWMDRMRENTAPHKCSAHVTHSGL